MERLRRLYSVRRECFELKIVRLEHLFERIPEEVRILAIVETPCLLIEVTKQVVRFDAHVGTTDATLEQTPEVFKPVGVDVSVHVLYGVIHNLMREITL